QAVALGDRAVCDRLGAQQLEDVVTAPPRVGETGGESRAVHGKCGADGGHGRFLDGSTESAHPWPEGSHARGPAEASRLRWPRAPRKRLADPGAEVPARPMDRAAPAARPYLDAGGSLSPRGIAMRASASKPHWT